MNFPISINFFTSSLLIILSLIGIIIFKGKKDKILMTLLLFSQILFLGIIFGYIKSISNLKLILSSISIGLTVLFLLIKQDRKKDYMYFMIHFTSLFQFLHILYIVT